MSGREHLARPVRATWLGRGLFILVLFGLGCSTDTTGLARRAPVAAGGTADEPAGAAGAVTSGGGASAGEGGASPGGGEAGEGAIDVVHGLVDGGSLLVCLWSVASGQVLGDDAPESGGVAYGQSLRLPTAWDLSQAVDVELFVAATASGATFRCSELRASAVDGHDISQVDADAGGADAGAPDPPPFPLEPRVPRRAGSLRLASGLLRAGAHYALVATGCTSPGGSPSEDICGAPDSLFESQQALVLAELAPGPAGDGLGIQFLNASRAVSRADLVLQGANQRQSMRLTNDVQFGAVRPRDSVSVAAPVGVELHVEGATPSSYTQPWADTVSSSGDPLVPGENHLLVFVGPAPGSAASGVGQPRFVLIRGH